VAKHGPDYSYDLAPRAKIFRRDAAGVLTFNDLKRIMRYNDYTQDPYSENNPYDAICSRGDLVKDHPSPGGCLDSKVTSYARARAMQAEAVNGPTHDDLPPFSWTEFPDVSHVGMPTLFNFSFEAMDPAWS
jgi:hypothetical protein